MMVPLSWLQRGLRVVAHREASESTLRFVLTDVECAALAVGSGVMNMSAKERWCWWHRVEEESGVWGSCGRSRSKLIAISPSVRLNSIRGKPADPELALMRAATNVYSLPFG